MSNIKNTMEQLILIIARFIMTQIILRTYEKVKGELGIKCDIRFMETTNRPAYIPDGTIAYTSVNDNNITVMFWLDLMFVDIINNIMAGAEYSMKTATEMLAKHEFRHVWQFSYCFGSTMNEGYKPYDFQTREADANLYALGFVCDKEAYISCCEDPLGCFRVFNCC